MNASGVMAGLWDGLVSDDRHVGLLVGGDLGDVLLEERAVDEVAETCGFVWTVWESWGESRNVLTGLVGRGITSGLFLRWRYDHVCVDSSRFVVEVYLR